MYFYTGAHSENKEEKMKHAVLESAAAASSKSNQSKHYRHAAATPWLQRTYTH